MEEPDRRPAPAMTAAGKRWPEVPLFPVPAVTIGRLNGTIPFLCRGRFR